MMKVPLQDWSRQLEKFITSRLGDAQLGEEIAQEAIARYLTQTKEGVEIRQPRAWLFRCARNLAVDVVRRRLPHPLGLEALAQLPEPSRASDDAWLRTAAGPARRQELARWLPEVLHCLPEADRRTLLRRYTLGMSFEDLAKEDGISLANAKVRVHRARRRLKILLERHVSRRSH